MLNLDEATAAFEKLKIEVEQYSDSIKTEADVRLKVINRVLIEVLNWGFADIDTETPCKVLGLDPKTTSYADFLLKSGSKNLCILEAKKTDFDLLNTTTTKKDVFKLYGPALKKAEEGIIQARKYSSEFAVGLAVLTNGLQWIFFRANRSDGAVKEEQKAIVFPSLEAIHENFCAFYELLAKNSIQQKQHEICFAEIEDNLNVGGIAYYKPITDQKATFIKPNDVTDEIQPVIKKFFTDMSSTSDPEMLRECFVETKESREAENELTRIIQNVCTNIISVQQQTLEKRIADAVDSKAGNEIVLIVGETGAGKSTFIDRFFAQILSPEVRKKCELITVNTNKFQGGNKEQLQQWLSENLAKELSLQLYGPDGPDYDDLKGIFGKDFAQLSKCEWAYEDDLGKKKKFGEWLGQKKQNSYEYAIGLMNGLASNRGKMPCVVFDNTDQFPVDIQDSVFQFAQAMRQAVGHIFLVCPLTNFSVWRVSKARAIDSYFTSSFHLPTPPMKDILEKRIAFIKKKVEETKQSQKRQRGKKESYFSLHQIKVAIGSIENLAVHLEEAFVNQEFISRIIGRLSNFQIREAFKILAVIITSPHLSTDALIKAYVKRTTTDATYFFSPHVILGAVIRQQYSFYHYENRYVKNVFLQNADFATTPLIKLRILLYLQEVYHRTINQDTHGFADLDSLETYFTPLQISKSALFANLMELRSDNLVERFDPSKESEKLDRVRITYSGMQHIEFAMHHSTYVTQMSLRSPLRSEYVANQIRENYYNKDKFENATLRFKAIRKTFLKYVVDEDSKIVSIPSNQMYETQRDIAGSLQVVAEQDR